MVMKNLITLIIVLFSINSFAASDVSITFPGTVCRPLASISQSFVFYQNGAITLINSTNNSATIMLECPLQEFVHRNQGAHSYIKGMGLSGTMNSSAASFKMTIKCREFGQKIPKALAPQNLTIMQGRETTRIQLTQNHEECYGGSIFASVIAIVPSKKSASLNDIQLVWKRL